MRHIRLFVLTVAAVFLVASTDVACAASNPKTAPVAVGQSKVSYAYLESWIGAMPTQDVNTHQPLPKGQTFWDDPNVKASLLKSIGRVVVDQITACWNETCVEQPIKKFQQYLYIDTCRAKDCQRNAAKYFFNLRTGEVRACLRASRPVDAIFVVADIWWEKGKMTFMPTNACDDTHVFETFQRRVADNVRDELTFDGLKEKTKK